MVYSDRVIFNFQDVLDVVQEGLQELGKDASEAQKSSHRDLKKWDCKALFLINQCVDAANFERIASATSAKQAWDMFRAGKMDLHITAGPNNR
jgi:uracil DNA glycosylase